VRKRGGFNLSTDQSLCRSVCTCIYLSRQSTCDANILLYLPQLSLPSIYYYASTMQIGTYSIRKVEDLSSSTGQRAGEMKLEEFCKSSARPYSLRSITFSFLTSSCTRFSLSHVQRPRTLNAHKTQSRLDSWLQRSA